MKLTKEEYVKIVDFLDNPNPEYKNICNKLIREYPHIFLKLIDNRKEFVIDGDFKKELTEQELTKILSFTEKIQAIKYLREICGTKIGGDGKPYAILSLLESKHTVEKLYEKYKKTPSN